VATFSAFSIGAPLPGEAAVMGTAVSAVKNTAVSILKSELLSYSARKVVDVAVPSVAIFLVLGAIKGS
jgi:hypothetical protein